MNCRRFFSDNPVKGSVITISGDEYHHLKHVNRSRCGDSIEVIDGRGSLFSGEIRDLKSDEAVIEIKNREKTNKPVTSVIAAPSLLKQRPMNLMIEKLTEMGVDEIRPLIFCRSDETYNLSRLKKWHRIAVQSLKVNKRLWLTEIFPPADIAKIIEIAKPMKTRILLDISGEALQGSWQSPVIAVIGPPGDITTEERQQLVQNGFTPYKINDCILKSETAAIAIAAVLKINTTK